MNARVFFGLSVPIPLPMPHIFRIVFLSRAQVPFPESAPAVFVPLTHAVDLAAVFRHTDGGDV